MVEKVDQVDPVLGLKDSSQVERWEAALRNPKGFIASQAPFDSTEPISEEEEEEKPNVQVNQELLLLEHCHHKSILDYGRSLRYFLIPEEVYLRQ